MASTSSDRSVPALWMNPQETSSQAMSRSNYSPRIVDRVSPREYTRDNDYSPMRDDFMDRPTTSHASEDSSRRSQAPRRRASPRHESQTWERTHSHQPMSTANINMENDRAPSPRGFGRSDSPSSLERAFSLQPIRSESPLAINRKQSPRSSVPSRNEAKRNSSPQNMSINIPSNDTENVILPFQFSSTPHHSSKHSSPAISPRSPITSPRNRNSNSLIDPVLLSGGSSPRESALMRPSSPLDDLISIDSRQPSFHTSSVPREEQTQIRVNIDTSNQSPLSTSQHPMSRGHYNFRLRMEMFIAMWRLPVAALLSVALCALTVLSWLLERGKSSCSDFMFYWLGAAALRALLSVSVKVAVELVRYDYVYFEGDLWSLQKKVSKTVEFLDFVGLIWVCIGTIILFPHITSYFMLVLMGFVSRSSCLYATPILNYTSLAYMFVVYAFLIWQLLASLYTFICPSEVDIVRSLLEEDPTLPALENWEEWLDGQQCPEMKYRDWQKLQARKILEENGRARNSTLVEMVDIARYRDSDNSEDGDMGVGMGQVTGEDFAVCSICLCGFDERPISRSGSRSMADHDLSDDMTMKPKLMPQSDDAENVVCFPCNAQHLFHVRCLHSWLSVSSTTHRQRHDLPCPLCRQTTSHGKPAGSGADASQTRRTAAQIAADARRLASNARHRRRLNGFLFI